MEYEPGLQWLCGLQVINYHSLSNFRVQHRTTLEGAGMIGLERPMVDGTKIRAQAGSDSLRRRVTIDRRLEQARAVVRQMGDPREEQRPGRQEASGVRRGNKSSGCKRP